MTDLMQLILNNESPSQISDEIKSTLHLKAVDKIDQYRPDVAVNLFNVNEE